MSHQEKYFKYAVNSWSFSRLWEHESQLHSWTDLLCVLCIIWNTTQCGGAQQGWQVHAGNREEHLHSPGGESNAQGEKIFYEDAVLLLHFY